MGDIILPNSGPLFFLGKETLQVLSTYGVCHTFPKNTDIIRENEPQINLYIVISGHLKVFATLGERKIHLAELQDGDCFGEVSIFEPGPASATVRTITESCIWYLDVQHLQNFLHECPRTGWSLILGINTVLSQRLHEANEQIKHSEVVPSFLKVRSQQTRTIP